MEIVDAFRDDFALEILPGAASDPIPSVDGRRTIHGLRAEIRPPSLAARPCVLGQSLALPVCAFQSAEIGALAEPGAGDKEGYVRYLRLLLLLRATGRRDQRY